MKKDINEIPIDVINQILKEFMKELSENVKPDSTTSKELLRLRLISKIWSEAVLLFHFQKLSLSDSERAERILDNWNEDLFGPPSFSPVKTLVIKQVWYSEEDDEEDEENENEKLNEKEDENADAEKCDDPDQLPPITVDQVAAIINRLGTNLINLTISFVCCLGVSLDVIKAVENIQDLKSLTLSFEYRDIKRGTYDLNSLSNLLLAMPQITSLTVYPSTIVNDLDLEPQCLSNLRHLAATYGDDPEGISNITKHSKNTLKTIHLCPAHGGPPENLMEVLEPVKDTLEGLFTLSFTDQLKEDVMNLTFPKLRVIGSQHCPGEYMREIDWLNVPMLKNVRMIVTDLLTSKNSWLDALRFTNGDAFKRVPNLKHIVFTGHIAQSNLRLLGAYTLLTMAFESNKVQCHLVDQDLPWDEIMKLDYKLNGPMN